MIDSRNHLTQLEQLGFRRCARITLERTDFKVEIEDHDACSLTCCIYAFVIGDEIVRIGSSKAPLKSRIRSYEGYVGGRLKGRKTGTPEWEAQCWKSRLDSAGGVGWVFARRGTEVTTPVGKFPTYLDEESILIGRFKPPLNRSTHR